MADTTQDIPISDEQFDGLVQWILDRRKDAIFSVEEGEPVIKYHGRTYLLNSVYFLRERPDFVTLLLRDMDCHDKYDQWLAECDRIPQRPVNKKTFYIPLILTRDDSHTVFDMGITLDQKSAERELEEAWNRLDYNETKNLCKIIRIVEVTI